MVCDLPKIGAGMYNSLLEYIILYLAQCEY